MLMRSPIVSYVLVVCFRWFAYACLMIVDSDDGGDDVVGRHAQHLYRRYASWLRSDGMSGYYTSCFSVLFGIVMLIKTS